MTVPLPSGMEEEIKQLELVEAAETLGVWAGPSGQDDDQLKKILERCKKWSTRTVNGHLPGKHAWISYRLKLWPAIRYGLGTLAAPLKVLDNILSPLEFKLLPVMGVNCHIKTG